MARQVSGPCGALKGFPLGHGQVAAGRPVPTLCGGAWRQEELQHPLKGGDGSRRRETPRVDSPVAPRRPFQVQHPGEAFCNWKL